MLRRVVLPILVVCALVSAGTVLGAAPRAYASGDATPVDTQTINGITVNICSNTSNGGLGGTYLTCGGQEHVGGDTTDYDSIWQCVEYAQRLYTDEGWHSGTFPGVIGAADIYNSSYATMGMSRQANGSITSIVPGDMIVHGANDKYSPTYGHVAIVDRISGSTVYAMQQNAPATTTYTLTSGALTGGSGTDILGIVHSPNNTNTGASTGITPHNTFDWPNMTYDGTDGLSDGQGLGAAHYIMSQNGEFALIVSGNGYLALYGGSQSEQLWSSGTSGSLSATAGGLALQNDGNVVLYNGDGSVLWSTGTGGNSGDNLVVQNDGNVVLYSWSGVAMWSTGTGGSFTANDTWTAGLNDGQSLASCAFLQSADGRFRLLEECNGDLYEYGPGNSPMWDNGMGSHSGATLVLQSSDGNLVEYATDGSPVWSTGTGGNTGDNLVVQNDGNVVLYSWSGLAMWATNT